MARHVDVKEILQKSTSDVPLAELAKKGFKQVKVLNKNTINSLIEEAVERVVKVACESFSEDQQRHIEEQSKAEFERLMARAQKEDHARESELRSRLDSVQDERDRLNGELQERKEQLFELEKTLARQQGQLEAMQAHLQALASQGGGGGSNMEGLEQTLKTIANQVARGGGGGGGVPAGVDVTDPEQTLDFMLKNADNSAFENNVGKVEVKNAKSKGLSKSLNKLKSMQNGGD